MCMFPYLMKSEDLNYVLNIDRILLHPFYWIGFLNTRRQNDLQSLLVMLYTLYETLYL